MRVRRGSARHRAKKRYFKEAAGNVMGRRKLHRTVKETILRARRFAWRDRRLKKRTIRALWITRITAACRARGLSYSVFTHGLRAAGIELNRKMLSELAIFEPQVFDELVQLAQAQLATAAA
jgi:large subunit ribosomal protein L20